MLLLGQAMGLGIKSELYSSRSLTDNILNTQFAVKESMQCDAHFVLQHILHVSFSLRTLERWCTQRGLTGRVWWPTSRPSTSTLRRDPSSSLNTSLPRTPQTTFPAKAVIATLDNLRATSANATCKDFWDPEFYILSAIASLHPIFSMCTLQCSTNSWLGTLMWLLS